MCTEARALRVLVVDDCPDAAESTAELLTLHGYEAVAVGSASAALILTKAWQPDVALLDLAMPGMNGYELARWLRVRGAKCPVLVAVTGLGTNAYRERATVAGFDHFLVKPVDLGALTALLSDYAAPAHLV